MTYLLRRLPLSRLLLLCGLVVAIGVSATAIAFALGTGPTPPPKPLADAVHDALVGPYQPTGRQPRSSGITTCWKARTSPGVVAAAWRWRRHCLEPVDVWSLRAALDLKSGRCAHRAAGRRRRYADLLRRPYGVDVRRRLEHAVPVHPARTRRRWRLQPKRDLEETGSTQICGTYGPERHHEVPSVAKIEEAISKLSQHANVSGATPTDIAGQPAYTVRVSPKESGSLLGGAELSFDAAHGVPLRAAVYSPRARVR